MRGGEATGVTSPPRLVFLGAGVASGLFGGDLSEEPCEEIDDEVDEEP